MFTDGRNLPHLLLVGRGGMEEHGIEEREQEVDREVPFSVITDFI